LAFVDFSEEAASLVSPDDVHIWFQATASWNAATIDAAVAMLSEDERERCRRFRFERDARDYAAAHALLRRTLSRHGDRQPQGWRFDVTPSGKPFLIDSPDFHPAFSLSHTRGMVACAITDGADVGVDVEWADRDVDAEKIAARFFAPAESRHLMGLAPDARRGRFVDLWTLKEALVKAIGQGIAGSLNRFAFEIGDEVRLVSPPLIDPHDWQFGLFTPDPGFRLAVAVHRTTARAGQLIVRSADEPA
jgi:4'-phosphopantetheinyl transferase